MKRKRRRTTGTPDPKRKPNVRGSYSENLSRKRKRWQVGYRRIPIKRRKIHAPGLTLRHTTQDPLFNNFVTRELAVDILKFIPLHELCESLCLVNKRWHNLIFKSHQLWELVIISRDDPRTPLSASSRVTWLQTCKVRHFIKDLNIALTMNYTDVRVLSELHFPALRELSVDIAQDDLSSYHFAKLLENHPHLQWINGEFSQEARTRAALLPLEVVSNLRCLGIERLYLNRCVPCGSYPHLKCIGHMRIFDEDIHLLTKLHSSMPNLNALSISIDTATAGLMEQISRWSKVKILYILCNLDTEDQDEEFDYSAWEPLRNLESCEMIMMVNFPLDWPEEVQKVLGTEITVKTEQNGLAFWNQTEPLVWED